MTINAIRSLQCPDHAHNIPPTVLSITWLLGKRCNYDCSYCSPHLHDAVSPFADVDKCLFFTRQAQQWAQQNNKKIKWNISGGEPFLDPAFYQLVPKIRSHSSCEQINVTTNGSLPFEKYNELSIYLSGITFSLHLERSQKEIDRAIDTAVGLQKLAHSMISINLMFLPTRLQQIETIIDKLQQHNINFVLRRISPPIKTKELLPYQLGSTRKETNLLDQRQQVENKYRWKILNDQQQHQLRQLYYTQDEIELLEHHSKSPSWHNMAAWYQNGIYQELNTDYLVANGLNQFAGWTCFAGVDQIEIDFDGTIYRGVCQEGGAIGHINDGVSFVKTPVICQRQWCSCTSDIATRKARSNFLNLVIGSDLANL